MKKRKISALLLSCFMACIALTGCMGNGQTGKVGVLRIEGFEGGNGGTYVQALADAYRKYNPGVEIEPICNPLVPEEAQTALEANSSAADIYMLNGLNIGSLCENADGALECLNDVYSQKPKTDEEEGDKTIESLINSELLPHMKYGGRLGGICRKLLCAARGQQSAFPHYQ